MKTNTASAENAAPEVDPAGAFNLETSQYLQDPVVVEVVQELPEDPEQNKDLRLALSMDKKDDQISSLSGLGM